MDVKVGILMMLSLAMVWSCGAIDSVGEKFEASKPGQMEKSEKPACTLCEQSVARAVQYFNGNNTQQQITAMLHASCSRLKSFAAECSKVVDYYAPIFFFELAIVKPREVCEKLDLCEAVEKEVEFILTSGRHGVCGACRKKVADLLDKLHERDTQVGTLSF